MAKATEGYIDSQEARKAAQQLRDLAKVITNYLNITKTNLSRLGQDWRDKKYQEFTELFNEDLKEFPKIIEDLESFAKYLIKQAEITEDYERNTKVKGE